MESSDYSKIPTTFQPFLIALGEELLVYEKERALEGASPRQIAGEGDLLSAQKIRREISAQFPLHNILGEEKGLVWNDSPHTWVLDPIDGSSNYGNGFPLWAISVALCCKGYTRVAMVYLPAIASFYWAVEGRGAFLNGHSLTISRTKEYQPYYLVGCSGSTKEKKCYPGKMRRLGTIAVDLAYLAEGKFVTIYEPETHIWDMIAGYLIAREAGAVFQRKDGRPMEPFDFKDIQPFEMMGKANHHLPDPRWE